MPHIFISYSRVDRPFVQDLVKRLKRIYIGDTIWFDESLYGGQNWWNEILTQIAACDIFMYLLSRESIESKYCQAELHEARRLNKQILPVMIRARTVIPDDLRVLQVVDMSSGLTVESMTELQTPINAPARIAPRESTPPVDTKPTPEPYVSPEERDKTNGQKVPRWLIGGVIVLLAIVVVILIVASNGSQGSNSAVTPTTAVALAVSDTPVATKALAPTNESTPTTTTEPSSTPTLSQTEYELAVKTQIAGIQTEAAQTAIAQLTATQAMGTYFAQVTVYANGTEDANKTATAILWTPTPTPDVRKTAEARLTETQMALIEQATQAILDLTATVTLWTATPTITSTPLPGYPGGDPITANAQWKEAVQTFDGVDMVLVPVGCFDMGSADGESDEQPVNNQCFNKPFWIDKYEVTNAQFAQFQGAAANQSSWVDTNRPRENITWLEAHDYCALRSGHLPTEAEWEYAARGPDDLKYPWGNDFNPDNVVYSGNSTNQTADVGSRPGGASWVGALDMSGNVWEWVSSLYEPYPYKANDGREDTANRTDRRTLRGGSWGYYNEDGLRTSNRFRYLPEMGFGLIGVRCARDYDG